MEIGEVLLYGWILVINNDKNYWWFFGRDWLSWC